MENIVIIVGIVERQEREHQSYIELHDFLTTFFQLCTLFYFIFLSLPEAGVLLFREE
jgi:hypothetical protein